MTQQSIGDSDKCKELIEAWYAWRIECACACKHCCKLTKKLYDFLGRSVERERNPVMTNKEKALEYFCEWIAYDALESHQDVIELVRLLDQVELDAQKEIMKEVALILMDVKKNTSSRREKEGIFKYALRRCCQRLVEALQS